MQNWRTTLFGALAGAGTTLQAIGVTVTPGSRAAALLLALQAIGMIGLGLSAADANKVGPAQ